MKPQTVTRLIAIGGRSCAWTPRAVDHVSTTLGPGPGCVPQPELPWAYTGPKCGPPPVGSLRLVSREAALYSVAERRSVVVTPRITFVRQIGASAKTDFSAPALLEVQYIESKALWGEVKILKQTGSEGLSEKAVG